MIGIDVVDLADPLLKNRADAFRLISHPDDSPALVFWQSWSAKEAVFKVQRQKKPFAPKTIPIQLQADGSFCSGAIQGRWFSCMEYWLAIASQHHLPHHLLLEKFSRNPSFEIRETIHKWFLEHFEIDTAITANAQGLPILSHSGAPVSLSHHGRYMAAAFFP